MNSFKVCFLTQAFSNYGKVLEMKKIDFALNFSMSHSWNMTKNGNWHTSAIYHRVNLTNPEDFSFRTISMLYSIGLSPILKAWVKKSIRWCSCTLSVINVFGSVYLAVPAQDQIVFGQVFVNFLRVGYIHTRQDSTQTKSRHLWVVEWSPYWHCCYLPRQWSRS